MNQTELIELLAKRMLEEKLSFLPLEESLQLKDADVNLDTEFYWVGMIEEVPDHWDLDDDNILIEIEDIYGQPTDMVRVGRKDEFDEFTHVFCPAPTYIDLIK